MWVASPYSPTHSPSASDTSHRLSKVNGSKNKEKNKSKEKDKKTHSPTQSIHERRGTIGAEVDDEVDAPGTVIEVDTRILAKACLRQIGREMGAEI
jgi:nicotinamidase-related amidase